MSRCSAPSAGKRRSNRLVQSFPPLSAARSRRSVSSPQRQTPPPKRPSAQKPTHKHHDAPVPPQAHPPVDGAVAVPSKWGNILLILQGLLSVLALVQLWRTQMLPVLYLVILAALLALLWLLVVPVQAASVPDSVTDALPPEAAARLEGLDEGTDHTAWSEGLSRLWQEARQYLGDALREKASGAALLLGVVLLCSVAESFFAAAEQPSVPRYVSMAGAMAITLTAAGDFKQLMGLGVETLEELDIFAKALLPTLSAAVAASGGMVSAGAKQVATVFFTNLLLSVIRKVLLPLLYGCIVAAAADAMIPGHSLKKIGVGIRKGVTWALTGVMLLFTGFLTLTGAASSAADALTMQMTRSAISAAVPVVGSIISDATGTVLAGAGMLKSAVGVFGMLAVLAICLTPFLTIAVQYLLYKLAAFLAGTMTAGPLEDLIDALGSAFGLMLGMTGSCALLLLISITSSVSVVVT